MPEDMPENTPCLSLNGEPVALPRGASLADLVVQHAEDPELVATAVNGLFVPRDQRARTVLQGGDAVTFFKAIVGG